VFYTFLYISGSFRSLKKRTALGVGTLNRSDLAVQFRTIRILVLDKIMIKYITVIRTAKCGSSSQGMCPYGIRILYPIDDIRIVDLQACRRPCPKPVKMAPIPHLVFHLGLSGLAANQLDRTN